MSWLPQIVFFGAYFVAWLVGELPKSTWVTVSAIAAVVIAILLLVDNRGIIESRRTHV